MAEASVPVRYLDDITTCPICTEPYTDPRTLPCIHTFCLKCISRWGRDLQPGDRVPCPLCRSEIEVPAAGFAGFPRNFFVNNWICGAEIHLWRSACDRVIYVVTIAVEQTRRKWRLPTARSASKVCVSCVQMSTRSNDLPDRTNCQKSAKAKK